MPNTIKTIPEWFMLNGVEVGLRAKRILGAVVSSKRRSAPFTGYRPNYDHLESEDLESIEKLWKGIWDDDAGAVPIDQFVDIQNRVEEDSAGVSVRSLLRTFAKQKLGKDVEIIGGKTKRYTIDNADSNMVDSYVKCKPWFDEVKKLHDDDKNGQLFFVTGVQVCWDLKVRYDEEKLVEVDVNVSVPNSATGQPVPGKLIEMNGKHYRQEIRKAETTFSNDRVVFAVRYNQLEPVYQPGPRRFLLFKTDGQLTGFRVGPVLKGNLSNYAASGNSAENEFYALPPLYVEADDEECTNNTSSNRNSL